MVLKVGDKAPDFTLKDQDGANVSLKDFRGKKVVLYFYPKDDTPGCTKEACSFRDNIRTFKAKGIVVLGVSKDDQNKHQKFISKYKLPFPLLSDEDKEVMKKYDAWGKKKFMGREYEGTLRKTFLIDEKGIIKEIIDKVKVASHGPDILLSWRKMYTSA